MFVLADGGVGSRDVAGGDTDTAGGAGTGAEWEAGTSELVACGGPESGKTRAGGQLGGGGDARICICIAPSCACSAANWAEAGSAPCSPFTCAWSCTV